MYTVQSDIHTTAIIPIHTYIQVGYSECRIQGEPVPQGPDGRQDRRARTSCMV